MHYGITYVAHTVNYMCFICALLHMWCVCVLDYTYICAQWCTYVVHDYQYFLHICYICELRNYTFSHSYLFVWEIHFTSCAHQNYIWYTFVVNTSFACAVTIECVVRVCVPACTYVWARTCVWVYMWVCVHSWMCVYVCMHCTRVSVWSACLKIKLYI